MSNLDGLSSSPHAALEPQDEVRIVGQYYDDKTARLIRKYGPGPRIHYHVGYYPSSETPLNAQDATPDAIRRSIRLHQEGLLRYAAKIWGAEHRLSGRILDVGCGLGGGSLFWAQEYGADVTAVTNAPEHAPIVDGFARECGVDGKVRTLVCDAMHLPLDGPYDAAVAIESSGYFNRPLWFERLARVLRPGGSVCIEEVFITRPHGADVWAEYFYTKPATVLDYAEAAKSAGFELVDEVDATSETLPFWEESAAWTKAVLDSDSSLSAVDRRQLRISLMANQALGAEWQAGGLRLGFLRFELK
ncbi:SAM-dependent methyltransferase [Streptomyces ipomoeae]|uniref:SAM-dependent methyltransferase n=1 Tax=Streptomyces ipomoeae TaxID=103232 RepID=UPI0011464BB6|nr:methyltransferase domain-containing protein [Streptomyces ipomoeae]MDX2939752.1 methyltransferase domain-containing protein [Streptomyces ipomoeae]TQE20971.1 methyltransferase domain-containing protein [Streptomyces ipomoeae]